VIVRTLAALLVLARGIAQATSGPELDWVLECQGCHRRDGSGTPPSVPAIRDSVAGFLHVPGGREYIVQVPGVAQAPLDDTQLAAVVNWMLTRFDAAAIPAGFVPYTAAEVATLRLTPLIDPESVRRKLVAQIPPTVRSAPQPH
jgi:hypothetical protein